MPRNLPTRDLLRVQFVFGDIPEESRKTKPVVSGNITVDYVFPYDSTVFSLSWLRSQVEAEHHKTVINAHRGKNESKKRERLGIEQISIDDVRKWFDVVAEEDFTSAVNTAFITGTTALIHGNASRVRLSLQTSSSVLCMVA